MDKNPSLKVPPSQAAKSDESLVNPSSMEMNELLAQKALSNRSIYAAIGTNHKCQRMKPKVA